MEASDAALVDRMMARVEVGPGCWLWAGSVCGHGYGSVFTTGNLAIRVHRLSYAFHKGPIPPGSMVLHRCDNRRCVNPDHLYLGGHAENMADMVARGRAGPQGSAERRFTDAEAEAVRRRVAAGESYRKLSEEFGVYIGTIRKLARGVTYRSAGGPLAGRKGPRDHARLTADQVKIVRGLIGLGYTNRAIARDFGVRPDVICNIRGGRTWKAA